MPRSSGIKPRRHILRDCAFAILPIASPQRLPPRRPVPSVSKSPSPSIPNILGRHNGSPSLSIHFCTSPEFPQDFISLVESNKTLNSGHCALISTKYSGLFGLRLRGVAGCGVPSAAPHGGRGSKPRSPRGFRRSFPRALVLGPRMHCRARILI